MVAEHSTESENHINFQDTRVLIRTTGHMNDIVKEATAEIWLHPDYFNKIQDLL